MRGKLTLKILEAASGTVTRLADFFAVFLMVGYGASAGRFQYLHRRLQQERARRKRLDDEERAIQQRFYNFISYLKEDGLLNEMTSRQGARNFHITMKGRTRCKQLQVRYQNQLPTINYGEAPKADRAIIVAFDIPEKIKRKRAWLRSALKNLGLKMIQKSFWAGKVRLPIDFIRDIERLRITGYVEIFELTKAGSMRHLF